MYFRLNLWKRYYALNEDWYRVRFEGLTRWNAGNVVYLTLVSEFALRAIIAAIYLKLKVKHFFETDILYKEYFQPMFFDSLGFLLFATSLLQLFALHYIFYFAPQNYVWQLLHELIFVNSRYFVIKYPKIKHEFLIAHLWNPASIIRKCFRVLNALRFVDTLKNCIPSLPHFPYLSSNERRKVALRLFRYNLIYGVSICMLGGIGMVGSTFLARNLLMEDYHSWACAWVLLDFACLTWIYIESVERTQFIQQDMLLLANIFAVQLRKLNISLRSLLSRIKRRKNKNKNRQLSLSFGLEKFYQIHTRIACDLHRTTPLFNQTCSVVYVTSTMFNVYMVTTLMLRTMTSLAFNMSLLIWSIQIFGILSMYPVVKLSPLLYNPLKSLYSSQLLLDGKFKRQKLRLHAYYQVLSHNRKAIHHVTLLGGITKLFFFEFIFIYVGYILDFASITSRQISLLQKLCDR